MALAAGARFGPYEILSALGAGGMGEVYRAKDTKLGRDVAIKVLPESLAHDPERLVRFEREAKTLAALNHPHIAHIHGFEDSTGVPALVMELVEGPTLADQIAKGPIPIEEALPIAKQIADALEAAHEQGIIHRDLKPANVAFTKDGSVKVLDFGLAKATEAVSGAPRDLSNSPTITSPAMMTSVGVILGTAAYMSPEQARGKTVDKRADIWAFGVLLYEMLAGRRAFEGEDVSLTLAAVMTKEPDWSALSGRTPANFRRLVVRCLRKDPKDRLRDVGDARVEIEELLRGVPEQSAPQIAAPGTPRWRRTLPWAIAAVFGSALLGALTLRSPTQPSSGLTRMTLSMSHDNMLTILGGVALSPDGRTVAFTARSSQGSRLYTRRLDEWEPRALPSTDGATNPSFSPDGQWIAFATGNILRKAPVSGGPSQVICKTGDQSTLGTNWRADGTVIFGAWPQVGLWRVSSDGGSPQAIVQPTEGKGVWYEWPEPLPGDRGIVFSIKRGGRSSIAVLAPGADKPRILIESGSRPRYVKTGHLVYIADSHLFAVPFDVEHLAVRSGATVVVDDMSEVAGTSDYDVSGNGELVYLPSGSSAYRIVWKDRRGTTLPLDVAPRRYSSLALSPDGERFSAAVNEGPSRNVWIGRVAGGPLTRLTFGNDDTFGLWSRDGARLFYSAGQENYNLFSVATDGSGKTERLTTSPNAQNPTSMSLGGDTVLFNYIDPSTAGDIWELSLSRKESRPLIKTPFTEGGAQFSPDGNWIAYVSNQTGQPEVYLQAYPGPGTKRQISVDGGTNPMWSHSGRELFYQTATAMFVVPILDAHDLRVGTPVRLFAHTRIDRPALSADDQRFLMLEPEDASQISQLKLVEHWFEELKARVPTK